MVRLCFLVIATLLTVTAGEAQAWGCRSFRSCNSRCYVSYQNEMCCVGPCDKSCGAGTEKSTREDHHGRNYTTVIDSPDGKVRLTFDLLNGKVTNARTEPVEEKP